MKKTASVVNNLYIAIFTHHAVIEDFIHMRHSYVSGLVLHISFSSADTDDED